MATYTKGILGPLSGKVGDKVFSSRNGISYVRRCPKKSQKPASVKQMVQRRKFAMAMHFLSPLRTVLNQNKREIKPKTIDLQATARQIISEAIVGNYPDLEIDFSKVSLIRGNLSMPHAVMSYLPAENKLSLCWEEYRPGYHSNPYDQLIALIYCPASYQSWSLLMPDAYREDEYFSMQLPRQCTGPAAYLWLAFYSPHGSISSSLYMGNVTDIKTYNHENKS